jgi:hypothetical protein
MRSDAIRAKNNMKKEAGGDDDKAAAEREDTPQHAEERWEHDKFNEMDGRAKDRDAASFGAHWSKIKSEKVGTDNVQKLQISHNQNFIFVVKKYR